MDTNNSPAATKTPPPVNLCDLPAVEDSQEPVHPTRRKDGRTPNPREADKALAADLNLPIESLRLFDTPDPSDAKQS